MKFLILSVVALGIVTSAAGQAGDTSMVSCPTSNAAEVSPAAVAVRAATSASGAESTLFQLQCGEASAELSYDNRRHALAFSIFSGPDRDAYVVVSAQKSMALLRVLLHRFFDEEGRGDLYEFSMRNYAELRARIAAASLASKQWDRVKGRPESGTPGDFVKLLINKGRLHSELADSLSALGYDINVSGVEEVLVRPVAQLTRADNYLVPKDSNPKARVAYAALLWFEMRKRR
jgi:hypothetical protein